MQRTATAYAVAPLILKNLSVCHVGLFLVENLDHPPNARLCANWLQIPVGLYQRRGRLFCADSTKSTKHNVLARKPMLFRRFVVRHHDQRTIPSREDFLLFKLFS